MSTDYRALCAGLLQAIDTLLSQEESPANSGERLILTVHLEDLEDCANRTRAELAKPEPEGVTDEDWRHELNGRLWDSYKTIGYQGEEFMYDSDFDIAFDAICDAVLQRYARPASHPVPVSERPWEREGWCDAEGRCYGWDGDYWWMVGNPGAANETITHCLPHWALPVPEQSLDSPYIFGTSVKEQMPPLSHP
jgi:hypothetical protein